MVVQRSYPTRSGSTGGCETLLPRRRKDAVIGFMSTSQTAYDYEREWPLAGVLLLTDDTFDAALKSDDGRGWRPSLVMFYVPWCGHCKRAAPALGELAKMVRLQNFERKLSRRPFVVAAVNAETNPALSARYEVKGYPTILLFSGDPAKQSPQPYGGPRTANAMWEALAAL